MPEFKIKVRAQVMGYKDITYTVEADNHDDAREAYLNGEADWYDDDGFEEYDTMDEAVQDVECQECYSSYDCSCGANASAELDEFLASV